MGLILTSLICLSADSNSFTAFMIWHTIWMAVMLISWHQLDKIGERK